MNDLVAEATGVDIMGTFGGDGDLSGAKAAAEAALRALGDKESMVGLYKLNSVENHSLKAPGFNPQTY